MIVDRWRAEARRPVPAASLTAFRVAFGGCVALSAVRFVANGWVERLLVGPTFHFTYPGFWWVRPLPSAGMYAVFAVMALAAVAFASGWRPAATAAVFTLAFAYVEAIEAATYLNHYELVTLLGVLCVVLPIPPRRSGAGTGAGTVPAGAVWLLRFQLGVVYVFAGIGKVDLDWLLRGEPVRTWLVGRADLAVVGGLLDERWVAIALSWAGAAFDLTIVGFLLWRRSRPLAYAAVVAFHVSTAILFPSIGLFPLMMIVLTPIFFDPDWPTRVFARLPHLRRPPVTTSAPVTAPVTAPVPPPVMRGWRSSLAAGAAAAWIAVQLVVPVRHLAYPGDVRWTEEGYRWSWRVLLTEKEGIATFRMLDPSTGRTTTVWPSDELAPYQVRSMSTRPDLIRQYARHLADRAESADRPRPRVYADVWVAIAGMPRTRLVDPTVDVAAVDPGLGPAGHIEPSPWEDT